MASLTEISAVARKTVIAVIVVSVVLVMARVTYVYGKKIYLAMNPPECPLPTARFGVLPALSFPDQEDFELNYRLETPTLTTTDFGPNIKVYFVTPKQSNLLALDRAKKQAASLGFVFEPTQVSDFVHRWDKTDPLPARMEMDIVRESFTIDVDWEINPGFLRNKLIPDEQQAINDTRSLLKRAGFLPNDMADGESKVTLLEYKSGEFIQAPSLSEADFVMVDLFRKSRIQQVNRAEMTADQIRCLDVTGSGQILPANPNKGLARVLISGSRNQSERYVSIEYKHTQIVYDQWETYPIISGREAWNRLQNGGGFVAVRPDGSDEAVVRRIDLGYYDSLDDSTYLQPIYIFTGDEFVGYVSAVADGFIQNNEKSN